MDSRQLALWLESQLNASYKMENEEARTSLEEAIEVVLNELDKTTISNWKPGVYL